MATEAGPALDLIGRRYGVLPHDLIQLPVDAFGFDLACALIALDAEKKAYEDAKTAPNDGKTLKGGEGVQEFITMTKKMGGKVVK